jgi:hypothetical protein
MRRPIFRVFKIIPGCCCCLWGYPYVGGFSVGVGILLMMAKDIGGFRTIVVSKMFLQLISRCIILQLWGPF